ncbi:NUDIX hydrolase, partial [bacterium]|nr:NUDIX hydrolase [bacterium]
QGWNIPGGIIRFKETLESRIQKVAETEIGATIQFDSAPLTINQLIHNDREERGHFISLLYNCSIPGTFVPANLSRTPQDAGYLMWHEKCPDSLLSFHEIYRSYI